MDRFSLQQLFSSSEEQIGAAYPRAAPFADKIVEVATNLKTRPFWLANLINFESAGTFSPSITNSLGYTGLIQFGSSAAQDLGVTTEYLRSLDARSQMNYVQKYFELPHKRRGSNYSNPIDLYMAVFYPAAIGHNPATYRFPDRVIKANNGIDTPLEYTRRANRNAKLPTGIDDQTAITQSSTQSVQEVSKWVWWVSLPLIFGTLGIYFYKRSQQ